MITLVKTITRKIRRAGVILHLFTGDEETTTLAGYRTVQDALDDRHTAAAIFGGNGASVTDDRPCGTMTLAGQSMIEPSEAE